MIFEKKKLLKSLIRKKEKSIKKAIETQLRSNQHMQVNYLHIYANLGLKMHV